MDKLAVYGTLRNGDRETYRVKDVSLVFPGHKNYPALIRNKEGSGAVVELIDVEVTPYYDSHAYDILIVYNIVGIEATTQNLSFILESLR